MPALTASLLSIVLAGHMLNQLESAEARLADAPMRHTPFEDVPSSHWAARATNDLRRRGILRGYPGGNFG